MTGWSRFAPLLAQPSDWPWPDLLDPSRPTVIARAPGRLDVMGGIADYSGSLVLELPLREATWVALQRVPRETLRIASLGAAANSRAPDYEVAIQQLVGLGYDEARAHFAADPMRTWAAYAAGAFVALARERGAVFPGGAHLLIDSTVPEGKGVSSSAALEVAVMQAVCAAFGVRVTPADLALLCQKVENLVAGAACGVMDQMTAMCGEANRMLALLCQPAEVVESLALPAELAVFGIDSGIRHAVAGADYTSVRVGAFMGLRMLAESLRLDYLVDIGADEFERSHAAVLPDRIRGAEFIHHFGATTDPVTQVDPERTYAVRTPTAHPVHEHARAQAFAELLRGAVGEEGRRALGELMAASHASMSACGLGSDGTDLLAELVGEAGPARGVYGARVTGGGCGGTVAVLARRDAAAVVDEIAADYVRRTGRPAQVFRGSSPGADAFGVLRLFPRPV